MHRFKLESLKFYRTFHSSTSTLFSQHLNDVGSMATHLESRSVIRFRGPDTIKFLQGLLTNDIKRFAESTGEKKSYLSTPNVATVSTPPMYAALLTPQGRFLYDFFLYKPPQSNEKLDKSNELFELLADVDSLVLDEILDCFKKYRLRAKVEIENVAKEFSCWQRFGRDLCSDSKSTEEPEASSVGYGASVDRAALSASQGNGLGWEWYKDPRLDLLGFRGIFPTNTTPPLVEADKETNEENYLQWRIEKGIAEGTTEIPKGEANPLEYNLAGLNAISFDKGCYVGQELVARTHHRGVIRKRLLPLKFVDGNGKELEQEVAARSEVIDPSSNKKVGTVTTALGCQGMGLLRLEEAFKKSGVLSVKGQEDVKVEAIRPEWWPAEWFPEHQQHSVAA
ncbi:hypothetical protein IFM89_039000 [Coptis chinensis]|uniref:CAF17 C-terminal domain-containing protein n=1 Tax=Coptis chinensis TaxID=261450 RepID=A0A835ILH0_9MAGN|nr:hypothetical protein IFM89_039000 [Coptis chinensis]